MNTIAIATAFDARKPATSVRLASNRRSWGPAPVDGDVLVERMVLGDGVAADELRRRYGKRLTTTAAGILGDETEAERVVALVFEEASAGWPPPHRGQVERWLTRLTRRAARDRQRALTGVDS